jgi:hypothetical protein
MRDLSPEELKHVYGAGSSYSSSKSGGKGGSKEHGSRKHASRTDHKEHASKDGKKRQSYC